MYAGDILPTAYRKSSKDLVVEKFKLKSPRYANNMKITNSPAEHPGVRVTISVPHKLSTLIDEIALREERSRSELIRDAVRTYFAGRAERNDEAYDIDTLKLRLAERDQFIPYDTLRKSLGLATASAVRKDTQKPRARRSKAHR